MLPKKIRAIFYWILRSGPIGRFIADMIAWCFYFYVKLFKVPPQKDPAGLTVISHKHKFIYFGIPKVASRSFFNLLTVEKKEEYEIEWHEKRGGFFEAVEANPDYFVFTFVRNPWSRILSCWKSKVEDNIIGKRARVLSFYSGLKGGMAFADFVKWLGTDEGQDDIADRHWLSQYELLSGADGKLLCDFVGQYEKLEDDWPKVCAHIGIEATPLAQKGYVSAEGGTRNPAQSGDKGTAKRTGYQDYYTDKTRDIIAKRYARDIKEFNYDF